VEKLTRRDFLNLTTMAAAGVVAAACARATPEVVEVTREVVKEVEKEVTKEVVKEVEKEVVKEVTKEVVKEVEKEVTPTPAPLSEAPTLRGLVSAGKLPPLDERLPVNPKLRDMIGATDGVQKGEIGQYGGTLYQVAMGVGQFFDCWHAREMYMLHPNNEASTVFPEVAEAYEFSADAKELTFHLRKGMKWSDGAPFTVDDIMFWWEEEQWNEEINPGGPFGWWKVAGEWTEFVKVDDFTLTLKFPKPYRPVISMASNWQTLYHLFCQPAHYVKNWHIKYNENANALAEEEGYDDWTQAYNAHQNSFWNQSDTNIPEQGPWIAHEFTTTYEIFDRNPYFFEVDPEGNQLPYIDQMYVYVVESRELMTAKAVTGEQSSFIVHARVKDMPLYKENEEKGDYKVREWAQSLGGHDGHFAFNQNHKDPVLREIFSDIRFRRAMSLAIDRQEVNDVAYFGKGVIIQSTISPECSYYKEEWGKAYIDYDVDQANALLDEMGLQWDAAKQWRLRSDGKPLAIVMQYNQEFDSTVFELVKEYWEAVGMQVELRAIERSLYSTRIEANEHDLGVWHSDRTEEIRCYMPQSTKFNPYEMGWARLWEDWFRSEGAEGEEPPQEWQDQYAVMDRWYTASTDEEYFDLAQQVWQFFSDQLVLIGTIGYPPQPALIKNGLMNVPEFAYRGDGANHLKTAWPQIWYWNV